MIRAMLALWVLCAAPAAAQSAAETIVAGMSQSEVAITARFEGSEILIYGAVRREAPPPDTPPLEVIVTVEGPTEPVAVRRKERRFGLWINTETVEVDAAPSFYAVAATAPLRSILSETEDLRHRISIPRAIRAVGVAADAGDPPAFIDALVRIRTRQGAFQEADRSVTLAEQTLFRADVALPANLTEGDYAVRIFLLRGGQVIDQSRSVIDVRKAGLERWLTNLAHDQPLAYGFLSLCIAVVAGWAASAGFRLIRS